MILNLRDKANFIKVDYKTSYKLQKEFKLIPYARDKEFVYFVDTPKLRKELVKYDIQV